MTDEQQTEFARHLGEDYELRDFGTDVVGVRDKYGDDIGDYDISTQTVSVWLHLELGPEDLEDEDSYEEHAEQLIEGYFEPKLLERDFERNTDNDQTVETGAGVMYITAFEAQAASPKEAAELMLWAEEIVG